MSMAIKPYNLITELFLMRVVITNSMQVSFAILGGLACVLNLEIGEIKANMKYLIYS